MAMKDKHIVENEVLSAKTNPLYNPLLHGNGEVSVAADFNHPLWVIWKEELEKIVLRHKWCFPDYEKGETSFETPDVGESGRHELHYLDSWGCGWYQVTYWELGQIRSHPLADMSKFMEYCPPDPLLNDEWGRKLDWDSYAKGIKDINIALRIFERTHFLMGMDNMMIALAEGDPYVEKIISMILQYNMVFINRKLEYGRPNKMGFCDDLGDQRALLISPALWRRYFKPVYRAMFSACRMAGVVTSMHSDGQISEIFDDFVEVGLHSLNCQVSLIGIDRVARGLKGRINISADIDRQNIMPFGTPNDVRDLVKEIIMKLGSPSGGLSINADIYPDVPIENIAAFLDTAEEYRSYWVGRSE